jgi:hypothetical protein
MIYNTNNFSHDRNFRNTTELKEKEMKNKNSEEIKEDKNSFGRIKLTGMFSNTTHGAKEIISSEFREYEEKET